MKYPIQVVFREYVEGILAAVFLALFLRLFVLNVLYIPTENMEPNLRRGDFIIGWRLSYGFPLPLMQGQRLNAKSPQRGDVVALRFPGDQEQILIRRVIGLPGEKLSMQDGAVVVNGVALPVEEQTADVQVEAGPEGRSYAIRFNPQGRMAEVTVPEGHVLVLSDNRFRSDDSRDWGMVPIVNIESEISFIWLSMENSEQGFTIHWPRILSWIN